MTLAGNTAKGIRNLINDCTDVAANSLLEISQTAFDPPLWSYGGEAPQEEADMEVAVEQNFCSDFACCGIALPDLHALLQHYENMHVKVEEEWPPQHPSYGYGRYSETPLGGGRNSRYVAVGIERQDSTLEAPSAFDTTVFRTIPSLPPPPHYSNIPSTSMSSPAFYYQQPQDQHPQPQQQQGQHHQYHHPHQRMPPLFYSPAYHHGHIAPPICTQPTMSSGKYAFSYRNSTHPGHHQPSFNYHSYVNGVPPRRPKSVPITFASDQQAINTLRAVLPSAFADGHTDDSLRLIHTALSSTLKPSKKPSFSSQNGGHDSDDDSSKGRPYVCKVEGCGKSYKNPNGLKYHTLHGHEREGQESEQKPHCCPYVGCPKRYKNPNGLKYHIQHGHPGQAPPIRKTVAALKNIVRLDQIQALIKQQENQRAQTAAVAKHDPHPSYP